MAVMVEWKNGVLTRVKPFLVPCDIVFWVRALWIEGVVVVVDIDDMVGN